MGATYLDDQGKEKEFVMGCYGIGVGRTVASAIEQSYDAERHHLPHAHRPLSRPPPSCQH